MLLVTNLHCGCMGGGGGAGLEGEGRSRTRGALEGGVRWFVGVWRHLLLVTTSHSAITDADVGRGCGRGCRAERRRVDDKQEGESVGQWVASALVRILSGLSLATLA